MGFFYKGVHLWHINYIKKVKDIVLNNRSWQIKVYFKLKKMILLTFFEKKDITNDLKLTKSYFIRLGNTFHWLKNRTHVLHSIREIVNVTDTGHISIDKNEFHWFSGNSPSDYTGMYVITTTKIMQMGSWKYFQKYRRHQQRQQMLLDIVATITIKSYTISFLSMQPTSTTM